MTDPPKLPPTHVPPRRRSYADHVHGRDVDAQERTQAILSALIGFLFGWLVGMRMGLPFPLILGGVPGAVFVYYTVRVILNAAGRLLAGSTFAPSGASTPHRHEYSQAESLVQVGDIPNAIAAYERYVAEDPADPEPYLRLARIHRDVVSDYAVAERWLRRARREATLDRGRELAALQELIELYRDRMHAPRKAIPELALLVERFSGTPAADAAAKELATLRAMLTREHEGGPTVTQQFLEEESGPDKPA